MKMEDPSPASVRQRTFHSLTCFPLSYLFTPLLFRTATSSFTSAFCCVSEKCSFNSFPASFFVSPPAGTVMPTVHLSFHQRGPSLQFMDSQGGIANLGAKKSFSFFLFIDHKQQLIAQNQPFGKNTLYIPCFSIYLCDPNLNI